jgi:hypothetical protein
MLEAVDRALPSRLDRVPSIVDALLCPDPTAEFLTTMRPGADAVVALSALDPAALSHAGLIDALVALKRQQAWLAAREHELLAALVADVRTKDSLHDPSGNCWLAEEVACALHMAPPTVEGKLATAVELIERLPGTFTLLAAGEISAMHALSVADVSAGLSDAQLAAVEARVLSRAADQTLTEFRRCLRRAVKIVDARRAEERHVAAVAQRRVGMFPGEDGMATIWAQLPADGARIVMAGLNRYATPTGSADTRTADQRRADALVELGLAALNDPRVSGEVKPAVAITVGLATLLGDNDQPGELSGYGPIPASMARRIAADPSGTWRRLVTDDTGRLLDYASTTYRPPADVARHVRLRDQKCVAPGCGHRADRCELDHRVPFPVGGTNADNLQPLCKRHHIMKHRSRWRLGKLPDGVYEWTTPTGHRYRYKPPDLPAPVTRSTGLPTAMVDNLPPPF